MALTNFQNIVAALATPAQDVENCLQQLLLNRSWDTAVGVQLDQLGAIVGQPRAGLDDDTYRRYVVARISTNSSQGQVEQLITIALLILGTASAWTVRVTNEGTATCRVFISGALLDDAIGAVLYDFMYEAKVAGVRLVTEWSESAPADTFAFDVGPGFDVGHLASDVG